MTAAPAIVAASYVRLSTLADGTVRVIVDIEPKDRDAAFSIFGAPGTPLAVARLTNEAAVSHDQRQPAEPADPLPPHKLPAPLSSKVAMTCSERSFPEFLRAFDPEAIKSVEQAGSKEPATQYVRDFCGVSSRAEIRPGTVAARQWESLKASYEHWQRTGEAA